MGYAKSQEEAGYNYEVPDNPLVIQRPDSSSQSQAEPQSPGGGGGGGGGGHHHHHGDDPLQWLRDSVPGVWAIFSVNVNVGSIPSPRNHPI